MNAKWRGFALFILLVSCGAAPSSALAGASGEAKRALTRLLLGKEVRSRLQLPATKEGIEVYYSKEGKHLDERGLDVKNLTKWLKERGVGVDANQVVTITEVKIDSDKVEIHLAGGGEGRRGSKHTQEKAPVYMRAGGSRVNFRYEREIRNEDLQPEAFLQFMGRILDVGEISREASMQATPEEFRRAIEAKDVQEGMSYNDVLLSLGEPEQKKIGDSSNGNLSEAWFYMKDGHRWVVEFSNGKVSKVEKF
jgi:hypothetical protein